MNNEQTAVASNEGSKRGRPAIATRESVERAAEELKSQSARVTVRGILRILGGSPRTISELLKQLSQINFQDRAFALLTLDDGRQVHVVLTGSVQEGGETTEQTLVPVITIDVDESLAGLDAASIRQRLDLLSDAVCWRSHWDDEQLRKDAETRARLQAIEQLDWPAEDIELPPDLSPLERREIVHSLA